MSETQNAIAYKSREKLLQLVHNAGQSYQTENTIRVEDAQSDLSSTRSIKLR